MSAELLLCVSQEENDVPFRFKMTDINVYSFEEALYHCYHYWKQSVDDFMSDAFVDWVKNTLGLSVIASNIKALEELDSFSDKLLGFLSLIDFFDYNQIINIKAELFTWERRLEWEKLKEKGDFLFKNSESAKAYMIYKKALTYEENAALLNNTGISLVQMEMYGEAAVYLEKALSLDKNNVQITINLAEAYIYGKKYDKAAELLAAAEKMNKNNPDIYCLYGTMYMEAGDIRRSVECFETAIALSDAADYYYMLADVYLKQRLYDKAIYTLNKVKEKDKEFLQRQAQIHVLAGNVPAAVKCMERALMTSPNDVRIWTKLAEYHRLDYDLNRASMAAQKAISIDPEDDNAKLESARIKKAMGKTKDYQSMLNSILKGFKRKYRELVAE